jgi:hypothetical protein
MSPDCGRDRRAPHAGAVVKPEQQNMPADWPCGEPSCKDWDDHDFADDYYGYKCQKCGLFFAYGCAPWEDLQ